MKWKIVDTTGDTFASGFEDYDEAVEVMKKYKINKYPLKVVEDEILQ